MSDYESIAMDAAYDDYMSSLYEEHKGMAIEEFRAERLQSYYQKHPDVGLEPLAALDEAKGLVRDHPSAALVFAASAVELGMKLLFLKPIVAGLVHSESTATLVADLTIGHAAMDRFRDLLFAIAAEHGGVDLSAYRRAGATSTLWEEMRNLQVERNRVLHQGMRVPLEEADHSVKVASSLIEELFPRLVDKLGLHTHPGLKICDEYHGP